MVIINRMGSLIEIPELRLCIPANLLHSHFIFIFQKRNFTKLEVKVQKKSHNWGIDTQPSKMLVLVAYPLNTIAGVCSLFSN